jgi:hypothetical protein
MKKAFVIVVTGLLLFAACSEDNTPEVKSYSSIYEEEWNSTSDEEQEILCMVAAIGGLELKDSLIEALMDGEPLVSTGASVVLNAEEAEQAAVAFIKVMRSNC